MILWVILTYNTLVSYKTNSVFYSNRSSLKLFVKKRICPKKKRFLILKSTSNLKKTNNNYYRNYNRDVPETQVW